MDDRCPYLLDEICKATGLDCRSRLNQWCLASARNYKICEFYPPEYPPGKLFWSSGPLRYAIDNSGHKLNVVVDPGITSYYRALMPKYMPTNPQMYPPHISVVRKEVPPHLDLWGKYEGEEVGFVYSNIVHSGVVYYWLNAFSKRLEEIRLELGLPVSTEYTRPPDSYVKAFHITLGNCK